MTRDRCYDCGRLIKHEQHEVWCKYAKRSQKQEALGRPRAQDASSPDAWCKPLYYVGFGPLPVMHTREYVEALAKRNAKNGTK